MKRDESVYLRHILDAISKIDSYLQDVTEENFMQQSQWRGLTTRISGAANGTDE
jgi:uncharacterized protein with HEPN domain